MSKGFSDSLSISHMAGDEIRTQVCLTPKVVLNIIPYKTTTYSFSSIILQSLAQNVNGNLKISQRQELWIYKPLVPLLSLSTCYVPGKTPNTLHGCSHLILHQPVSRWNLDRLKSLPKIKQVRAVAMGFELDLSVWLQTVLLLNMAVYVDDVHKKSSTNFCAFVKVWSWSILQSHRSLQSSL